MSRRYEQLDSIRGFAAVFVVMNHIILVPALPYLNFSITSVIDLPLNVLAGRNVFSYVNLFFVLSGFVLSLPYVNDKSKSYLPYIISRFFRLYIPYIVAVTVSILGSVFLSTGGIEGLSDWFNRSWTEPLTMKKVIDHLMMIGNFNTNDYDNVIWSLVHEMRISLILPVLTLLTIKVNWKFSLLFCFVASFISGLNNIFNWQNNLGYHTSIYSTLQIISMFLLGILLAKHKNKMILSFKALSKLSKIIIFIFTVFCFLYNEILTVIANYLGIYFYGEIMSDYAIGLGSVLIILISLASTKAELFLTNKAFLFMGKISYSLYLFHLPILFSLVYLFHNILPLWLIITITVPLAVIISTITWHLIEKPANRFGKKLADKVEKFTNKNRKVIKKRRSMYKVV